MRNTSLFVTGLATLAILGALSGAQAETKTCKIKIVGGSFKGHSMKIKMKDGKFVDDSSIRPSKIPTCRGQKYFYGRWYHMCAGGKIAVMLKDKGKWRRLHPDNEKKYIHNCF